LILSVLRFLIFLRTLSLLARILLFFRFFLLKDHPILLVRDIFNFPLLGDLFELRLRRKQTFGFLVSSLLSGSIVVDGIIARFLWLYLIRVRILSKTVNFKAQLQNNLKKRTWSDLKASSTTLKKKLESFPVLPT
jgi:hypothetical protein